ncbi:hypothetical protein PR202_ga24821 [Eleusine coracana subsp. coracana]|uniref:Uncharacterized protein n=1 Tax=Eleusine coracana subsp. coracana TaxID=191504 RepID=A0AAV5DAB8_ELECO|nr:hypothetical protein PR202_ga24821 [Eleusine coracana subsp. coracana]
MDQFPVASQQSSLTAGSAESTAAPAARAPNGIAAAAAALAPAPAPAAAAGGFHDDDDDVPEPAACISTMIDRGGSVESHRLFLARRTVLEMLHDRGYSVQESELARTLPEFREWWAGRPELERLAITTTLVSDHSSKVFFFDSSCRDFFIDESHILSSRAGQKGNYQGDIQWNQRRESSRLILVLQGKIMSQARESIKDIFPFKVDTFQITELLVNITKHVLKPKHEVLTEEEKSKLLKEYNVKDSQLPRMLESDAVARYYGLGKGTVVKVIYDSELTGNHVTYRCIF